MNMNEIFGAVVGDIAGSTYEAIEATSKKSGYKIPTKNRAKILKKSTLLFPAGSEITDDTILTCAIANAIINKTDYAENLRQFGQRAIDNYVKHNLFDRFGKQFTKWCTENEQIASYGNGCAMRVSACALAFNNLEKVLVEAQKTCEVTHNLPECIALTRATAGAIFLAKDKKSKQEIQNFIETEIGHKLDYNIKYLRENYIFTSNAVNSIPQALFCFLKSKNFEHCLRLSLSIGGDSDTICAIACSIAGTYYGIPDKILNKAKEFIPEEYLDVLEKFNEIYGVK